MWAMYRELKEDEAEQGGEGESRGLS